VPPDTPPTIPVDEPIVAIDVLPLIQVPPLVALLKAVVPPTQTVGVPVMDAGNGLTVTIVVTLQQADVLYVMVVVPDATPYTIPVPDPTVATLALLLLQVPPDVALLNVVVDPAQTFMVPVIAGSEHAAVTDPLTTKEFTWKVPVLPPGANGNMATIIP
jgi:hypothetical protein